MTCFTRNKNDLGEERMKKIGQALRRAAFVSPLVFFGLFSLALAQNEKLNSKPHVSLQASDKVITITLKMSDNRVITVSQYDGEMVRTGPKEGEKLGITPYILDNGSVALDFFRITKIIRKGVVVGEATMSIGSMELNSPHPQATPISLI